MKRLVFEKLTLMSSREKRGRILDFHNKVTVLKGENDVGKSSLLKTLFKTFGTDPHKETERWKNAHVNSLVDFTVDNEKFSLLRSGDSFALFDKSQELIDTFSSVTKGLSPKLANLFDFHLSLQPHNSNISQATPAFLFLPFYADQDKSWGAQMEGFARLSQFRNSRQDVVYFHTGIRPNEFYLAKSEKIEAESLKEDELKNIEIVKYAIKRIKNLFVENEFALELDDFKKEVEELIQESNKLVTRETSLKNQLISLRNLQLAVDSDLAIVFQATSELEQDFDFAAQELADDVECPTCGAHYENSIGERFAIASDEDTCRELIQELQERKQNLQIEYDNVVKMAQSVQADISHIDQLLKSKKGDVNLREILQSEGRKEVKEALENDKHEITLRIAELDQRITDADEKMKSASDKKKTARIKKYYYDCIMLFLDELAVKSTESDRYKKIDCNITESGSDGPRALLAYQFAILHTINKFSTSTFCPIVIDSPNQQDQDDENWAKIREFIKNRTPQNAQLILGLVDDGDTDFGGSIYEFTQKYNVLEEQYFDECSTRMRPMIDAMISARQ